MSTTVDGPPVGQTAKKNWFLDRTLDHYPPGPARYAQLVLAVLATIILYYQLYAVGGVSTLLSVQMHMSFGFLVTMLAVANLIGAFGSLAAGVADRLGRANLVVYGLLVVGLLTVFAIPATTSRWTLGVMLSIVGFIEGMLLVATPALVRDFSPQVGRAAAMGIWNVGPVAGSLIVAIVASATLTQFNNSWESQFRIAGIAGIVMFVIALFFMKELSPKIRDQLMVDTKDRELLEARAASGDVTINLDKPFKQLLRLDIVGPSIGFGALLLLYFTLVGFSPILYATVFHFDASQANGVAAWAWGANVVVTLFVGFLFDWSRVRKPWMLIGGVLTIIFELILLFSIGHDLSFGTLSVICAFMSGSFGFAAVAFYAAFTETIEARNPALIATGLAIWGWIIRVIAFLSFLVIPYVVTSATTLLESSPYLAQAAKAKASGTALSQDLTTHLGEIKAASTDVYGQWQIWLWICVAGVIVFMLTTPLLRGPWSPRKAKELLVEHDRQTAEAIANLHRTHTQP